MKYDIFRLNEADLGIQIRKHLILQGASTLDNPKSETILFAKKMDAAAMQRLEAQQNCLLILSDSLQGKLPESMEQIHECVYVANPRLMFAKALGIMVQDSEQDNVLRTMPNGSLVGQDVLIGEGTQIGSFVQIDCGVVIGKNCRIHSGVKIKRNVIIGDGVEICDNTVIGSPGFGYETDETGRNYMLPHVGGVIIGNNTRIGVLSRIAGGTIEPTVIGSNVMIDDNVAIGHNVQIGDGCGIATGTVFAGSVVVGKNTWIAPGVSIIQKKKIGSNCTVGIGTVVVKNVKDGMTIMANQNAKIF